MRRRLLADRRSQSPAERQRRDEALVAALRTLVSGRAVAGYVPMADEPGGTVLLPALATATRLLLPVLGGDLDLDWAEYRGELVSADRGLREPPGPRLGQAAVAAVDLVIVPAVAVDRRGLRLGRGGGSYDRALARVTGDVAAVVYDTELVEAVPAEPHDRRVTLAVTPSGVVRLRTEP